MHEDKSFVTDVAISATIVLRRTCPLTKPFGQEASNPSTAADGPTVDFQNRKVAQGCT